MGKVIILGGGPAGLALSYDLARSNQDFILIEREEQTGGLAKTLSWKSHGSHDLGPHKIFTTDQQLMQKVMSLLPKEDWLNQEKKSRIFMNGCYLPYPPSPFSLVKVYGPIKFLLMTLDYVKTLVFGGSRDPKNFEDDLKGRVGRSMYAALFKPIAEKLWGPPSQLDVKLSKGRVQTPSFFELILQVLRLKKKSNFEALTFLYPKGGLQKIWDRMVSSSQSNGQYFLGYTVKRIVCTQTKIEQIEIENEKTQDRRIVVVENGDFVFSSLPMGLLPSLMTGISPQISKDIRESVILNDLFLVFVKFKSQAVFEDSWVFVPDPSLPFHRLSEQKSFDPGMTPQGSILCSEIMSGEHKNLSQKSDQELFEMTIQGLQKMGVNNLDFEDFKVIRLPKSYPVYRVGYEPKLRNALQFFDLIQNFRTIGRQGAFNYIGTLDALDMGFGSARWYLQMKDSKDPQKVSWEHERERTSHYPVLD